MVRSIIMDPSQLHELLQNSNLPLSPCSNRDDETVESPSVLPRTSPSRSVSHSQSQSQSPAVEPSKSSKGKNALRREHKKSRAGCFNCKTRKIKCQETRPECENCTSKGITCRYPTRDQQRVKRHKTAAMDETLVLESTTSATTIRAPLQSTATKFTMKDMRFFHHFLTMCYPHLPLGNEKVWVTDVPQIAHHHEFLMHAILSLAASHMTATGGMECSNEALAHRHLAVQGLNASMASLSLTNSSLSDIRQSPSNRIPAATPSEQDAMLAACYALTFESSYAGLEMSDFIIMVRGCALVTGQIQDSCVRTSFNVSKDAHFKFMASRMADLPVVTGPLVTSALTSFENVEPLLSDPIDRKFYSLLLAVLLPLSKRQSVDAYIAFCRVFTVFYETSHGEFQHFISTSNATSQILQAHFIALQMLVVPFTRIELDNRPLNDPRLILGPITWAQKIWRNLSFMDRSYVDWPMRVVNSALAMVQGLNSEYEEVIQFAGPLMEFWRPQRPPAKRWNGDWI